MSLLFDRDRPFCVVLTEVNTPRWIFRQRKFGLTLGLNICLTVIVKEKNVHVFIVVVYVTKHPQSQVLGTEDSYTSTGHGTSIVFVKKDC